MKIKLGTVLMTAGAVLITAALCLFLYNENQQRQASAHVEAVIPQVVEVIQERQQTQQETPPTGPAISEETMRKEMPIAEIDGHSYIGFLGIPALELELPVMADWSYPQLQISPCRYTGDLYQDNLVLMAHNYEKHFGRLSKLRIGDTVTFTTMDAETVTYEVVALEVLGPYDIADMTAGHFALTLFTCTYGGENRVTVRCDRA